MSEGYPLKIGGKQYHLRLAHGALEQIRKRFTAADGKQADPLALIDSVLELKIEPQLNDDGTPKLGDDGKPMIDHEHKLANFDALLPLLWGCFVTALYDERLETRKDGEPRPRWAKVADEISSDEVADLIDQCRHEGASMNDLAFIAWASWRAGAISRNEDERPKAEAEARLH